ncbi:MAG TPA: hypothetical protein VLC79_07150 [Cellvibrio sp.]|nr:hypothetical protein [Cellvibrio sp.]
MHKIHRWAARCVAATSLILALPASAYMQFTYTSQAMPLTSYFIEAEPVDFSGYSLPAPSFSISFIAQELDLGRSASRAYAATNLQFSLISPEFEYIDYPLLLDPSSYGRINLGLDGSVESWDLALQMTELITPETDLLLHGLKDHHVNVASHSDYGDQAMLRFHAVTWHRQWIQAAQLELTFSDLEHRGTWTVENIALPEPGLAGLFMSGLAVLVWARRSSRRLPGKKKYV